MGVGVGSKRERDGKESVGVRGSRATLFKRQTPFSSDTEPPHSASLRPSRPQSEMKNASDHVNFQSISHPHPRGRGGYWWSPQRYQDVGSTWRDTHRRRVVFPGNTGFTDVPSTLNAGYCHLHPTLRPAFDKPLSEKQTTDKLALNQHSASLSEARHGATVRSSPHAVTLPTCHQGHISTQEPLGPVTEWLFRHELRRMGSGLSSEFAFHT
ncbi:unnamed protein product [Pleuronectes platessa]|uniref:Uncharacterized protein n=1 Tax=Pleuronectes platessa TaxID=8262 RepID=A0A9N7VC54_PLEPL|nr:unnamed protein product [Pleuronectes platessa]